MTQIESKEAEITIQQTPLIYRKEFLKDALAYIQTAASKLQHARGCADTQLDVAKDMITRLPTYFAQADTRINYLIQSPGKLKNDDLSFNKNVFFESTPERMHDMQVQLQYVVDAASNGITATTGDEFRERTASAQNTLKETITFMTELSGMKQRVR